MGKIVDFFKKIIPMSAYEQRNIYSDFEKRVFEKISFMEQIVENNTKKSDENIEKINEELKNTVIELKNDMSIYASNVEKNNSDILEKLLENDKFLINNIDALSNSLQKNFDLLNYIKGIDDYNSALYFVGFEKEYYKNYFNGDFLKIDNFYDRVVRLRKGLDDNSLETVSLIINRLKFIYQHNYPVMNIFCRNEQKEILELRDNFHSNVIQIDENIYCYKNYFLPRNHFEACVFYYRHSIDMDIIDAGGFIGDSALIFSSLTDRKVYSFEPSYENYNDMLKTIELNSLNNVVAENIALSDKSGKLKLNICSSSSSFYSNNSFDYTDETEVNVITLDEYVEKNNLKVGLIKTDLEGAEQEFLRGAINTIKKFKPILRCWWEWCSLQALIT